LGISSLSVVCCTRDRPAELARLIRSILAARRFERPIALELLVIDDGNLSDQIRQSLADQVRSAGIDWVYFNKSARAGLLRSRIEAVGLARHDWLLFFDDDVEIERDYLARFCQLAGEAPDVAGLGGVDILTRAVPAGRLLWRIAAGFEPLFLGQLSFSGFPAHMDRARRAKQPFLSRRLYGCNMGFRRSALAGLRPLPGFEGYSLYEDAYLSFEAARHGRLLIDSGLQVRHHHSPSARDSSRDVGRMSVLNHLQLMRLYGGSRWRVLGVAYSVMSLAGWLALTGFSHRSQRRDRGLAFVRGQMSGLGALLASLWSAS
jgi:glycosyltransferase involved in cell wall biosynthesis